MPYLAVTLNHFKAIQSWMEAGDAQISLNVRNFELEVRWRHRFYTLYPRFLNQTPQSMAHGLTLTQDSVGFIGWLPYRPLSWELAADNLVFKRFLREVSERTPSDWTDLGQVNADFVLKRSKGSFGYELAGPFSANEAGSRDASMESPNARGTQYAEQFIAGDNLKIWFWGAKPFYAQRHPYPEVQGDGRRSVKELITERLLRVGQSLAQDSPDGLTMQSVIRYQGLRMDGVPELGRRIWLDYRYGRTYERDPVRSTTDNVWPAMDKSLDEQCKRIGRKLAAQLQQEFPAPVLYSLDGVVDALGQVWWLEMNSNPILPPDGYPSMFETLFGASPDAVTASTAAAQISEMSA